MRGEERGRGGLDRGERRRRRKKKNGSEESGGGRGEKGRKELGGGDSSHVTSTNGGGEKEGGGQAAAPPLSLLEHRGWAQRQIGIPQKGETSRMEGGERGRRRCPLSTHKFITNASSLPPSRPFSPRPAWPSVSPFPSPLPWEGRKSSFPPSSFNGRREDITCPFFSPLRQ